MSTEVRVPTLGESVTEATVATWFKQPGDAVAVDEMLCELETDKVAVEISTRGAVDWFASRFCASCRAWASMIRRSGISASLR